jgi:hypothetical protein
MVNSRPERDAQGSTNTDSSPGRLSKSPLRCTLVAHDTLPGYGVDTKSSAAAAAG